MLSFAGSKKTPKNDKSEESLDEITGLVCKETLDVGGPKNDKSEESLDEISVRKGKMLEENKCPSGNTIFAQFAIKAKQG